MVKRNNVSQQEQFWTPAQLAERWHLHEESVRRMLRANRLACLIIGRRKLIPLSAILAFEAAATVR
jgi:hypothetical protein